MAHDYATYVSQLSIFTMWVKRTDQEIETAKLETKRTRKILAILLGGVFCLGFTFLHGSYWRAHGYTSPIVSIDEVPYRLPFSFTGGVIAGFLLYWSKSLSQKTVVCPRCGKVKRKDSQIECSCGANFEDMETMKWKR